jgi:ribonuclease HI
MYTVSIWCDGACATQSGAGGWAAILELGEHEKILSGGEMKTTNNRMELQAVIHGLEALMEPCRVIVYTDSEYVANAFLKNWLQGWIRRSWTTSSGKPVANQGLWERLIKAADGHTIAWKVVKGHSGIEMNERVDKLAVQARIDALRDSRD